MLARDKRAFFLCRARKTFLVNCTHLYYKKNLTRKELVRLCRFYIEQMRVIQGVCFHVYAKSNRNFPFTFGMILFDRVLT